MNYQLSVKAYTIVMTKVCNARFGEVLANYRQINKLKGTGKIGLCQTLLGMGKMNGEASTSDVAVATAPTFSIIQQGHDGAVDRKIFDGMTCIVSGAFKEVNSYSSAAFGQIREMIKSFGGKVALRFSKNTSESHAS